MINTLLIIDDDQDVIIYTEYLIKKIGMVENFVSASNGEEGLEYLKNNPPPDLILLDINMPRMNGWEFIEEYKKLNLSKPILISLLTVSINPDDKRRAEGMNIQFISKPLTPEKLESLIKMNFPDQMAG